MIIFSLLENEAFHNTGWTTVRKGPLLEEHM